MCTKSLFSSTAFSFLQSKRNTKKPSTRGVRREQSNSYIHTQTDCCCSSSHTLDRFHVCTSLLTQEAQWAHNSLQSQHIFYCAKRDSHKSVFLQKALIGTSIQPSGHSLGLMSLSHGSSRLVEVKVGKW